MKFPFVMRRPASGSASLAPMLPIRLGDTPPIAVEGLLDTGAAVNVLPWSVGERLGFDWDALTVSVPLGGMLAAVPAKGVAVTAVVGHYPPVRLVFAWAKTDAMPLLLGQMNFFLAFDVCFFRAAGEFEVRPRGTP